MRGIFSVAAAGASLLPLAVAAPAVRSSSIATTDLARAPLLSASNAEVVADSYIVVFNENVDGSRAADHHLWVQNEHLASENTREELRRRKRGIFGDSVNIFEGMKHTYNIAGSFMGYSGHFDEDIIEKVRSHPDVAFVERDSIVHTLEPTTASNDTFETEKGAPWGLARISHRDSLSFSTFNKYLYATDGGEGVDVYVIDTGTSIEHVDFEGRAHWGKTIPANDEDLDGNGHGTHCSGTIGGKKYGVAKKAEIYAVKVLKSNGSGSMADVVKGVDFAATSHVGNVEAAKSGKKKGFKGSAANMSLGGGKSPALDRAVNGAVEAGIHFAVAAGNDNADACNYSPAAAEMAITVGASTIADERAYFSNYGKCTDIFAPGYNILSTWIGSKYAVNTISGTSMASPHIAGLAAYMLSLQPAKDSAYAIAAITPKELKDSLIKISTKDSLSDIPSDTPNYLAWNGGGNSNYTAIVAAGGFAVQHEAEAEPEPEMPTTITELEDAIKHDFQMVGGEIVHVYDSADNLMEELKEMIEDVEEAMKDATYF